MLKDDEVNLVFLDKDLSQKLNDHFIEDLEHCEKVDPSPWEKRGVFRRGMETVTKLFKQQI